MVKTSFKEIVFTDLTDTTDIVRHQMNGLTREALVWNMVGVAPILKQELQEHQAEYEVLYSYVAAVKHMANDLIRTTQMPGMMILTDPSLCIPLLFVCRHTIELAIKTAIKKINGEYPKGHRIIKLWEKFKSLLTVETEDEQQMLNRMEILVKAIDDYDPDGSQSRYAMSNNKELYHKNVTFIKADRIALNIELFVKQLEQLTVGKEEENAGRI